MNDLDRRTRQPHRVVVQFEKSLAEKVGGRKRLRLGERLCPLERSPPPVESYFKED